MSELIKEYWDAIGVRTIVTATDRTLMMEQFGSGEFMVSGWAMDGAAELAVGIGTNGYLTAWQWGPQWNTWYSSRARKVKSRRLMSSVCWNCTAKFRSWALKNRLLP